MFIITQALGMPRDVERRESGYIFLRQTISSSSYESSKKRDNSAKRCHNQTMTFTPRMVG